MEESKLMEKKRKSEEINIAIMENEKDRNTNWEYNLLAELLYWFVDFFNIAFFKDQPVPTPVLSFERTSIKTLGHYVIGRNSFGVRENINLNRWYLNRPLWETLSTLLHELTHSWEYLYIDEDKRTNNWYHPKAFRTKMLEFGLVCNNKGQLIEVKDPFLFLLKKHAVESPVPDKQPAEKASKTDDSTSKLFIAPPKKPKGKSKNKKWSCGCTNARVAIANFEARCLKCGNIFELIG